MLMLSWFVTGILIGFAAAEIVIYMVLHHDDKKITDEEFVKELVKQKGWYDARWELEAAYRGKYMRIWRKLYRKHIEGGNND